MGDRVEWGKHGLESVWTGSIANVCCLCCSVSRRAMSWLSITAFRKRLGEQMGVGDVKYGGDARATTSAQTLTENRGFGISNAKGYAPIWNVSKNASDASRYPVQRLSVPIFRAVPAVFLNVIDDALKLGILRR